MKLWIFWQISLGGLLKCMNTFVKSYCKIPFVCDECKNNPALAFGIYAHTANVQYAFTEENCSPVWFFVLSYAFLMKILSFSRNLVSLDMSKIRLLFSRSSTPNQLFSSLWWRNNASFCRLNSSSPENNGCHMSDDIFRCIFVNENFHILIGISLQLVPKGTINNKKALVKIMS